MLRLKLLLLALVMAASVPAYGGVKETARAEYKEGTTAFNLGHFDEAVQHYEAAYKLVPDPNMLFNIAQSYRLGGKYDKALPVFRAFLREAPADAPNRGLAERFVEELKRKIEETKGEPVAPASPPSDVKPAVEPVPVPAAPVVAPAPAPAESPVAWVSPGLAPTPAVNPVPAVSAPSPASAPALPAAQPMPPPTPVAQPEPPRADPLPPSPVFQLAPPPGALVQPIVPESAGQGSPFYTRWWFWTLTGTVVAAGAVTAFLLLRRSPDSCDGVNMRCVGIK